MSLVTLLYRTEDQSWLNSQITTLAAGQESADDWAIFEVICSPEQAREAGRYLRAEGKWFDIEER